MSQRWCLLLMNGPKRMVSILKRRKEIVLSVDVLIHAQVIHAMQTYAYYSLILSLVHSLIHSFNKN